MKKTLMTLVVAGCASLGAAQYAVAQTATDIQSSMDQDKVFLKHAAEGGYAEVQFGQLAAQKATNPDVKAFAQKMVDDHTALNNNLMPFAQRAEVKPPTQLDKKDKMAYDRLSALSGDAFDKAYVQYMVMDHKKDLGDFKGEVHQTNNPDLKAAVQQGEQVIAGHYEMVQKLAGEVGAGGAASAGGK
jgi:putative membrane protein